MIHVTLETGNSGGEYGYFLSKLAYAWETGNAELLADLYRFFAHKGMTLDEHLAECERETWDAAVGAKVVSRG